MWPLELLFPRPVLPNGVYASANGGCDRVCWQCLSNRVLFKPFDHRESVYSGGARRPLSSSAGSMGAAPGPSCLGALFPGSSQEWQQIHISREPHDGFGPRDDSLEHGPCRLFARKSGWFLRVSSQALRFLAQAREQARSPWWPTRRRD